MSSKLPPFVHPLHLVIGFIIWAFWLTLVYAGLSLSCMAAPAPETLKAHSWINIILLGFTIIVAALLFFFGIKCWHRIAPEGHKKQTRFILRVSAAVYVCGSIATLAVGIPALMLPPCL